MNDQYELAFNELKAIGAPVFTNEDNNGNFSISAEQNDSEVWADYYSEDSQACFGVSSRIDHILNKHGLLAEWVNPGYLSVYTA